MPVMISSRPPRKARSRLLWARCRAGFAGLFFDRVAVDVGHDGVHGDGGRVRGEPRGDQGGDEAVEDGKGVVARVLEAWT